MAVVYDEIGKMSRKSKGRALSEEEAECECEEVDQGARVQLCALTPNLQVW